MPSLPGPNGSITFTRDDLGYPSLRVADALEGAFALGYLHALDRLAQVQLMVLAGRGELMSVLGDTTATRTIDRVARLLNWSGDLELACSRLDPETRTYLEAYSRGFNAGAQARGRPLLSRLLNLPDLIHTPASMMSVYRILGYFGLTSTQLSAELIVAELVAAGATRRSFELLLGDDAAELDLEALAHLEVGEEFSFFEGALAGGIGGSNACAVDGRRSASGGALLLSEFHLEIGRFPPAMYAAHVEYEGGDTLSGLTVPGTTFFAAGRTRHVGWTYTYAHGNNVDVRVDRVEKGRYLTGADASGSGGEMRAYRRRTESVHIKGKPTETWLFYDSDHGSVLGDAEKASDRPVLRVAGLGEISRDLANTRELLACRSIDDLAALQQNLYGISLEALLVDAHGDIGSVVTGSIDQRPNGWRGGTLRAGWDLPDTAPEPLGHEHRPCWLRPPSGTLASANQGGQRLDEFRGWCTRPQPPYRVERLRELLARKLALGPLTLEQLAAFSYDQADLMPARLLPVWAPLLPKPLAREFESWQPADEHSQVESRHGLFHRLHAEVCYALLETELGPSSRGFEKWGALLIFQNQLDRVLALECPELLDAPGLERLLERACERLAAKPAPSALPVLLPFKSIFTPPRPKLAARLARLVGLDSAPVALPGTPTSLFQTRQLEFFGTITYGPAFHLVFDMKGPGAWYNLPGGASESRLGAGYGKGVDAWVSGSFRPLGRPEGPPPDVLRSEHAR